MRGAGRSARDGVSVGYWDDKVEKDGQIRHAMVPNQPKGDDNAFANSGLQLPGPAFVRAHNHRRAGDAWEETAVTGTLRHEIVGKLAQRGESSGRILTHRSGRIQNKCLCDWVQ